MIEFGWQHNIWLHHMLHGFKLLHGEWNMIMKWSWTMEEWVWNFDSGYELVHLTFLVIVAAPSLVLGSRFILVISLGPVEKWGVDSVLRRRLCPRQEVNLLLVSFLHFMLVFCCSFIVILLNPVMYGCGYKWQGNNHGVVPYFAAAPMCCNWGHGKTTIQAWEEHQLHTVTKFIGNIHLTYSLYNL